MDDKLPALDDDRVAEDALRQATSLHLEDQNNPVVKCLDLEKSNREQKRQILALNKLTMTLEMRLQGFKRAPHNILQKVFFPRLKVL